MKQCCFCKRIIWFWQKTLPFVYDIGYIWFGHDNCVKQKLAIGVIEPIESMFYIKPTEKQEGGK